MTGSARPLPLLLVSWAALGACLTSASDILEYYILEELAPRRVVGDIVNDFGFGERYDRATVDALRFSVLKHPAYDRRFFAVNETTGVVVVACRTEYARSRSFRRRCSWPRCLG